MAQEQQPSEEWKQQFLADREKVQNDPTYRAELKTMDQHLGRDDPRYPTTPEQVQQWFAEQELARQVTTQEHIFSYPDGSVYMGHMRHDAGKRHGRGTLRTPAFVYGEMKNYTSDEAAENAHLAKWHEYAGTWENDKLHGHGVHVQKSGDGGEILVFEGIWKNGKPMRSVNHDDDDGNDDDGNDGNDDDDGMDGDDGMDDSVFGW